MCCISAYIPADITHNFSTISARRRPIILPPVQCMKMYVYSNRCFSYLFIYCEENFFNIPGDSSYLDSHAHSSDVSGAQNIPNIFHSNNATLIIR
jgi:hypothetical protein